MKIRVQDRYFELKKRRDMLNRIFYRLEGRHSIRIKGKRYHLRLMIDSYKHRRLKIPKK